MKRVDLEATPHDVRAFIENLPADADGIELALRGEVVWKLTRPGDLSDAERHSLLARGREIVREVRQRTKGTTSQMLQKKVDEAVSHVR